MSAEVVSNEPPLTQTGRSHLVRRASSRAASREPSADPESIETLDQEPTIAPRRVSVLAEWIMDLIIVRRP